MSRNRGQFAFFANWSDTNEGLTDHLVDTNNVIEIEGLKMPDVELPDLEVHERIKGQWVITDSEKTILFVCHARGERAEQLTRALVAAAND